MGVKEGMTDIEIPGVLFGNGESLRNLRFTVIMLLLLLVSASSLEVEDRGGLTSDPVSKDLVSATSLSSVVSVPLLS